MYLRYFLFVLTFLVVVFLVYKVDVHAFASKVPHLRDPELRKLTEGLPLRAAKVKPPATMDRYSRAFQKFREWSSSFE